jgi:hypothetical protein
MRLIVRSKAPLAALPLVTAALFGAAAAAHAQQGTLIDEGSFRVLVGGQEVGTETFSIRQTGTGNDAVLLARGRVVLDSQRGAQEIAATLQVAGAALRPAVYELTLEGADAQRIAGRVVGGRFSARIVSATGETGREYLVSDGAVVLDEGVAHHYYFLARRVSGGTVRVPIVIPRESRQLQAEVTDTGRDNVSIGGTTIAARRLTVAPNGSTTRTVWVDGDGRVLRLEIPERNFVAVRTAAP